MAFDVRQWFLNKLDGVVDEQRVLVRDPLHLLPEKDNSIHNFAIENGFSIITAATNLAFRDLYEKASADPDVKVLVIDRTPLRRRQSPSKKSAPPLFYPDLLAQLAPNAQIELDLRQLLREETGDDKWPLDTNSPPYARLIMQNLDGVLRAYHNLRVAEPTRFSDSDFQTIVAYAALGVADSAFKRLDDDYYWRVGLFGYRELNALEQLVPTITKPIKAGLAKAQAPFCWLVRHDPETVIGSFYLSVILAQHSSDWKLLLVGVDPSLARLTDIAPGTLGSSAARLINLDPDQARTDLEAVETSLSRDALRLILFDHLKVTEPGAAATFIEQERYSTLLRCVALLFGLDNLLSPLPARDAQTRIMAHLFSAGQSAFVNTRQSAVWANLKEAYELADRVQGYRQDLVTALKAIRMQPVSAMTFGTFRDLWNGKRINRLEYQLSALKRLIFSQELLPRESTALPDSCAMALERLHQRVQTIEDEVFGHLDDLNRYFQEMVAAQYPTWLATDGEVRLASHFMRRCVKPNWDVQTEKAVILVFDGMRYDIWDELLRPVLEERLDVLADLPAVALLPSETWVSRWALAAGAEPDRGDPGIFSMDGHKGSEGGYLQRTLQREFGLTTPVQTIMPDGAGTGETVRYRAGNLDYYIFEFCDKELHRLDTKELPDGRREPTRPLSLVYQQYVKTLIDTEVMAIIRSLNPGTKVFITADHGFGRVGHKRISFAQADLNTYDDCAYLYALLRLPPAQTSLPSWAQDGLISFTPNQLRYPQKERTDNRGVPFDKEYKAIVFPKVGYSFNRPSGRYNPPFYGHGGISLAEVLIPMIVLQVKDKVRQPLSLILVSGSKEVIEGEMAEFRFRLVRAYAEPAELRVDVAANFSTDPEHDSLPRHVVYIGSAGDEVVYRFNPSQAATTDERRAGQMRRNLSVVASYRQGNRTTRTSLNLPFVVRLDVDQVVRRVPTALGNLLGLTPRGLRGSGNSGLS